MLKLLTEKPQWTVIEVLFTRNPILFIPQPVNLVIDFFYSSFLPGLYTRKSRPELI